MRLNELKLMTKEEFSKLEGVRIGPIAFFYRSKSNTYTWRGMGQTCPSNEKIVCVGKVALTTDGVPVAVSVDGYSTSWAEITSKWSSSELFEPHQIKIEFFVPGIPRTIAFERCAKR